MIKSICSTLFLLLLLTACSDSKESSSSSQNITEPVSYPFIVDGTLFEYIPSSSGSSQLASGTSSLATTIDLVEETSSNTDNLPEYYVYLSSQDVNLLNLETRRTHTLYTFNDLTTICEVKPLKVAAPKALASQNVVINDAPILLMSISESPLCENLQYIQLKIEESFTETYTTTTEFPDPSQSFELPEGSDCGEVERDVALPINRKFTVEIKEGEDCDKLATPDIINETEEHAVLVGKISEIDEALFDNGDQPIVDTKTSRFGYLGYNSAEQKLKFYLGFNDLGEADNLTYWEHDLSAFYTSDMTMLKPQLKSTNGNYDTDTDFAILMHGPDLLHFDYSALFDDDELADRLASLNNPIFSYSTSNISALFNSTDLPFTIDRRGNFALLDDSDLFYSKHDSLSDFELVRILPNAPEDIEIALANNILVKKNLGQTASVSEINSSTGIESTLVPAIERIDIDTYFANDEVYLNIRELDNNSSALNQSQIYDADDGATVFDSYLTNAIIAPIATVDPALNQYIVARTVESQQHLVFYLDKIQDASEPEGVDSDGDQQFGEQPGEGKFIGIIEGNVDRIMHAEIFSEEFGLIKVQPHANSDAYRIYYFNPSTPYDDDLQPSSMVLIYESPTAE